MFIDKIFGKKFIPVVFNHAQDQNDIIPKPHGSGGNTPKTPLSFIQANDDLIIIFGDNLKWFAQDKVVPYVDIEIVDPASVANSGDKSFGLAGEKRLRDFDSVNIRICYLLDEFNNPNAILIGARQKGSWKGLILSNKPTGYSDISLLLREHLELNINTFEVHNDIQENLNNPKERRDLIVSRLDVLLKLLATGSGEMPIFTSPIPQKYVDALKQNGSVILEEDCGPIMLNKGPLFPRGTKLKIWDGIQEEGIALIMIIPPDGIKNETNDPTYYKCFLVNESNNTDALSKLQSDITFDLYELPTDTWSNVSSRLCDAEKLNEVDQDSGTENNTNKIERLEEELDKTKQSLKNIEEHHKRELEEITKHKIDNPDFIEYLRVMARISGTIHLLARFQINIREILDQRIDFIDEFPVKDSTIKEILACRIKDEDEELKLNCDLFRRTFILLIRDCEENIKDMKSRKWYDCHSSRTGLTLQIKRQQVSASTYQTLQDELIKNFLNPLIEYYELNYNPDAPSESTFVPRIVSQQAREDCKKQEMQFLEMATNLSGNNLYLKLRDENYKEFNLKSLEPHPDEFQRLLFSSNLRVYKGD